MEWRHGTYQCPRCRFKVGCCEGLTGECRDLTPRSDAGSVSLASSRSAGYGAEEWRLWREARLRMLREEAARTSRPATRTPSTSRTTSGGPGPPRQPPDWTRSCSSPRRTVELLGVVGGFRRLDPAEAQLVSLWVDPDSRGRGVARSLIRAVAAWAEERGARTVVLFVQEANAPGRALYLRAGFRPTGAREPVGRGRPGFKLVVSATVDELLGSTAA